MARARREIWQERVTRWHESGLTAREFAAQIGVNANTLANWRYKLQAMESAARRPAAPIEFIEVTAARAVPVSTAAPDPYDVFLANGRALRVPPRFDAEGLRRLLAVLEGR